MKTVLFYGALGYPNQKVVGGGESGNLKTIGLLSRMGYDVIKIYKPYPKEGRFSAIIYILNLLLVLPRVIFNLIRLSKDTIVHISGFYMHLIYIECSLILLVKLFGRRCVYELRGGGVQSAYDTGSVLYRFFFKKAVLTADVIMSQGEKYVGFLEDLGVKNIVHYPNYLERKNVISLPAGIRAESATAELVYFGRLSKSKNIDFILDVAKELKDSGFSFVLDVIGTGDVEYVDNLQDRVDDYDLGDNVSFLGPMFGDELFNNLRYKHFFIFPSIEPREGHSNALTEALALGIVPICSEAGFNRQIVSREDLVVGVFDKSEYARRIMSIWNSKAWLTYSIELQNWAQMNFSEEFVFKRLSHVYSSLGQME